jgi:polar amino acid transport system permease protein
VDYSWDFGFVRAFSGAWLGGVWITFYLSSLSIVGGTALGILLVLGSKARWRFFRWISLFYIDIFRALPALVLMGTLYFCLPIIIGIAPSALQTAMVALAMNLAPFAAECIRSGWESVPTVQYESGRLCGFRGWRLSYYIIGPQALRRILPPLIGQYVTTLKLSSLAATIGVVEIWNVTSQVVTATSRPVEARLIGAALYCLIILPTLWLVLWLERKYEVGGLGEFVER